MNEEFKWKAISTNEPPRNELCLFRLTCVSDYGKDNQHVAGYYKDVKTRETAELRITHWSLIPKILEVNPKSIHHPTYQSEWTRKNKAHMIIEHLGHFYNIAYMWYFNIIGNKVTIMWLPNDEGDEKSVIVCYDEKEARDLVDRIHSVMPNSYGCVG